jgi:hypothetical protein
MDEYNKQEEGKDFSHIIIQLRGWLGDDAYREFIRSVIEEVKIKLIQEVGVN